MANGVLLKKKQNKRHEKKSPLGISRGAVRCILQWVPSIAPKKQDGPFGPIGVVGQETWRALLAETQRLLFMLLVSLSVLLIDARSMYVSILIFLFLSPFPSLPFPLRHMDQLGYTLALTTYPSCFAWGVRDGSSVG